MIYPIIIEGRRIIIITSSSTTVIVTVIIAITPVVIIPIPKVWITLVLTLILKIRGRDLQFTNNIQLINSEK